MDVPQIVALAGAATGVAATVGTLVKIRVDRKHGMKGTEIQSGELDLARLAAVQTAQGDYIKIITEDNADLRARQERYEEKIDRVVARNEYLEDRDKVWEKREEILFQWGMSGIGPPPPDLPPFPEPIKKS